MGSKDDFFRKLAANLAEVEAAADDDSTARTTRIRERFFENEDEAIKYMETLAALKNGDFLYFEHSRYGVSKGVFIGWEPDKGLRPQVLFYNVEAKTIGAAALSPNCVFTSLKDLLDNIDSRAASDAEQ